jgi:hypothetical protein
MTAGPIRPGRRSRKGFIKLHRQAISAVNRILYRKPGAAWTLVLLMAEADIVTGELRASIRWLTSHLGFRRETLKGYLDELSEAHLISISYDSLHGEGTVIRIEVFEELQGLVADGPESEPTGRALWATNEHEDSFSPAVSGPLDGSHRSPSGGSVGGSLFEPRGYPRPGASQPKELEDPEDLEEPEDSEDTHVLASLEPEAAAAPRRVEDHPQRTEYEAASDIWGGLWRGLVDGGIDEGISFLVVARAWCKVRNPAVPLAGERRRIPTLTVLRGEAAEVLDEREASPTLSG